MKKTKIVLLALASLSTLASCGKGGSQGDPNTIQIYAWESGTGKEWLQKIVDSFNASQSEYKATLETSTNSSTITKTLDVGTSNPYDLYFTNLATFQYYDFFEPFDDVLNFKHEGESMTIGEKFYPGFLDAEKDPKDGKHRVLNYGNNVAGIVYNRDLVDENNLPRTTNELADLVLDLQSKNITPWLFYNQPGDLNGYWNYVSTAWAAQYDGLDYFYNNLMALKDADGKSPSRSIMEKKDGRYEALKVMEDIITPSTTHQQCTNTQFTTVQTLYLKGEAALTINGSWLLNENKSNANVALMKTPVISSIVKKLENTKMSDETLSEIVKQIDEGATTSVLCSDNDFSRIKEARNVIYNNAAEQYIFAPTYSNALEGTKEFVKYLYKDSSILTYMNTLHLPFTARLSDKSLYDDSKDSSWAKSLFEIAENKGLMMQMSRSSVYRDHGVNPFCNIMTAQSFLASNPKDRKNAEQVWNSLLAKVDEEWEAWTNE